MMVSGCGGKVVLNAGIFLLRDRPLFIQVVSKRNVFLGKNYANPAIKINLKYQ
jgi:hypothetical protein